MAAELAANSTLGTWSRIRSSMVLKVYLATMALFILSGVMQPHYFSWDHLMQTLVFATFLGIIAMGQTLVILTGGIDLSVAYILNFGAVMISQLSPQVGGGTAALIVCVVGVVLGVLNGLGIAFIGIPPLIMTLGMNSIVEGLTLVYTNGTPKGVTPHWLTFLSSGSVGHVRVAVVVWIALSAIVIALMAKTTFGRRVYALGNNSYTAYLSGTNTKRVLITVYALSGLFSVIGGMLMTGFLGLSYLGMGDAYQLSSIAAVVIGGTSILGGMGGYLGTVAGAVIIYILQSILTIINIQDAGRDILYGLVILLVLFLYGRSKGRD